MTLGITSALIVNGVSVSVNPTDTVIDSFVMNEGRTGVVWQITNDDGSQILTCRPQTRESNIADWVDHAFTEELSAVGPGATVRVLWRFITHEVRLVGTASGAGLDATVFRRTVFGVQPT